jgi:hypothetical protein
MLFNKVTAVYTGNHTKPTINSVDKIQIWMTSKAVGTRSYQ